MLLIQGWLLIMLQPHTFFSFIHPPHLTALYQNTSFVCYFLQFLSLIRAYFLFFHKKREPLLQALYFSSTSFKHLHKFLGFSHEIFHYVMIPLLLYWLQGSYIISHYSPQELHLGMCRAINSPYPHM